MFLYKVLKNNEVTFVGTTEVMNFSEKSSVYNQQWWKEKDKILYTEIEGKYTANFYKKILKCLYKLETTEYQANQLNIHEGSLVDNFNYTVFFDSKLEIKATKNEREKAEENQKRKERLLNKRKKLDINIEKAYLHPQIDENWRFIPLHFGHYPKSEKISSIYELRRILIVVPKNYSLKGLREIKRLYLKIIEEKTNTLVCQADIDSLIQKYGEFYLLRTTGDECKNLGCSYSPLFTSPAFFMASLNHKKFEDKLGFKLYATKRYFHTINYQLYCPYCEPEITSAIKKVELNRKKAVIRRNNNDIEVRDREFWRAMILELDNELKQSVGLHLSNVYINFKNPAKAQHSIKVLYDLGFAKKIPDRITNKKLQIPGICCVGDYYYETTLSQEFKRLKDTILGGI